jgi:hypothetical protein
MNWSVDAIDRRAFLGHASVLVAGAPLAGGMGRRAPSAAAYAARVPAAWFDLALELVRTTPGFSPPVAARALAYTGIALHEAVMPRRRSFAGKLRGLEPAPRAAAAGYHWPTVANAALATVLRDLFPTTPDANRQAIDRLERRFRHDTPAGRRAAAHGARVARHIFEWSRTDGGHEGFARNTPPYVPPQGPGLWVPTPPARASALQPFWGANRPFLIGGGCAAGPPLAYSEDPASPFYAEGRECHDVGRKLTPEQIAIARFWSDDPGTTATPAGHWFSIATQTLRALDAPLDVAAEAYANVGVAVSDAFIACWRTKFRYNLLRPVTYVQRVLDQGWMPLLVTPPFPEYTSGHSVQSTAAAEVLTDIFGRVSLTDRTHAARGLPARTFPSFRAAAREAAISRLYGGIHFRAAIERGTDEGRCIGRRVRASLA